MGKIFFKNGVLPRKYCDYKRGVSIKKSEQRERKFLRGNSLLYNQLHNVIIVFNRRNKINNAESLVQTKFFS